MRRTKLVFQLSCVALLALCSCGKNNVTEGSANVSEYIQDSREDIKTVVGSSGFEGSDTKEQSLHEESVDRSVGSERGDTQTKSKTESFKDKNRVSGEEDRGTDSSSESLGAGDGFNSEYDVSDPVSVADSASNIRYESDSSAGWDGGMENDSAVSDSESGYTEQYDYDSTYQYGDTDSGLYEEPEEYSVPEPEVSDTEYSESDGIEYDDAEGSVDGGWSFYGTAFITHYCPCEICCGAYSSGYSASGTWATEGRTVAAGYSIPFGTEVMINGNVYIVEDRGVDDGCFDIFVSDHQRALDMGAYYTEVYIRW